MVVTKHRFGYAIASLQREDPAPVHLLIGTLDIPLHPGETIIGRDITGTPDVSRHHARIVVDGDSATVEDLQSKNGTWLSGRRITSAPLYDGAELILGRTRAVVRFLRDNETLDGGASSHRKFRMITSSLTRTERVITIRPSRETSNASMAPESKCVSWRGGPPRMSWVQMFWARASPATNPKTRLPGNQRLPAFVFGTAK